MAQTWIIRDSEQNEVNRIYADEDFMVPYMRTMPPDYTYEPEPTPRRRGLHRRHDRHRSVRCDMASIYELAKKYYPKLWDEGRLRSLVAAEKLTPAEFKEITGIDY